MARLKEVGFYKNWPITFNDEREDAVISLLKREIIMLTIENEEGPTTTIFVGPKLPHYKSIKSLLKLGNK